MSKYWFKPKTYGYGYVPINISGWITVLITLGLLLLSAYINDFFITTGPSIQQVYRFLLDLILLILALDPLMRSKTKGEVKWRWGN